MTVFQQYEASVFEKYFWEIIYIPPLFNWINFHILFMVTKENILVFIDLKSSPVSQALGKWIKYLLPQ